MLRAAVTGKTAAFRSAGTPLHWARVGARIFAAVLLPTLRAETAAMYDMNNLKKLKKLGELAPGPWQAFRAFDEAAMADGALSAKQKELIALGVALTTQCPYCLEIHTKRAKAAGCSEAEIAETTLVAAALRAGAAVTHGTHCLE
jgi:AhpD family alkylhydroperoxidase